MPVLNGICELCDESMTVLNFRYHKCPRKMYRSPALDYLTASGKLVETYRGNAESRSKAIEQIEGDFIVYEAYDLPGVGDESPEWIVGVIRTF